MKIITIQHEAAAADKIDLTEMGSNGDMVGTGVGTRSSSRIYFPGMVFPWCDGLGAGEGYGNGFGV